MRSGGLFKEECRVYREKTYGNSRFDLYVETAQGRKAFIEVKGVTLEEEDVARFRRAYSAGSKACERTDPVRERRV